MPGFDFDYEFFPNEVVPTDKETLKRIERELWDVARIMHVNNISELRLTIKGSAKK
jgi:hypothetical protein